jgi:hypothetical protein
MHVVMRDQMMLTTVEENTNTGVMLWMNVHSAKYFDRRAVLANILET